MATTPDDPVSLFGTNESLLALLLVHLDCEARSVLGCTCRLARDVVQREEWWQELSFDETALKPAQLLSYLRRARGGVQVLRMARSHDAREVELQHRIATGVKLGMSVPYTRGLRALSFAALCPRLQRLSLDERASCVGGMTNDFARALATHCPQLRDLAVYFERYSPPSELFDDHGLIAISEGCRQLTALGLHNADQISDRSLYALAANCRLSCLALAGYNENITDGGLTVLFEACKGMTCVKLSSKLLKVTDASTAMLARHCPGLAQYKMTRRMTNESLVALAAGCRELEVVDMRRCTTISEEGLLPLLAGCSRLARLLLPPSLTLGTSAMAARPRCQLHRLVDEESQVAQQQTLIML